MDAMLLSSDIPGREGRIVAIGTVAITALVVLRQVTGRLAAGGDFVVALLDLDDFKTVNFARPMTGADIGRLLTPVALGA